MGFLTEQYREHRLRRGDLPRLRALDALPRAREGEFVLGVASGGGKLAWHPLEGDPPHLLWAGTTGSGKTRGMVAMGLAALSWGWDVEVIDFKGGGDYFVLAAHGAAVWITPEKSIASLKHAAKDIRERNRAMWETPLVKVDENGRMVEDRAVNFADLHPAVKEERGWRPRLILIDETASLVTIKETAPRKGQGTVDTESRISGMEALRLATQLGRSAGVHIVLGMQRPDADLLEGFIKHNIQARIITGKADRVSEDMVHGSLTSTIEEGERLRPRPPGRGVASGFGDRPGCTLFQAYLLSKDAFLPDFASPPDDPPSDPSVGPQSGDRPPSSVPSDTPPGIPTVYPDRGYRRSLVRASLALLWFRLVSLRLFFGPLRAGPFVRDPSLAVACKRAAGRCRACGSPDRLEADHRRPLWAGGRDLPRNLWALCSRCHGAKTSAEARVRAGAKRLRRRPGIGWLRLRGYQWFLAVMGLVGALDALTMFLPGLLRFALIASFVVGCVWQFLRRNDLAGEDGMLGGDRKDERRAYRGTLAGAHVASAQAFNVAKLRLRAALLWIPGAYLMGGLAVVALKVLV